MGLFNWLRRLLGFENPEIQPTVGSDSASSQPDGEIHRRAATRRAPKRRKVRLVPLRYRPPAQVGGHTSSVGRRAYRFARPSMRGGWLDLTLDQDASRLASWSRVR